MNLLAVLFAALLADIPWGNHLNVYDQMVRPACVVRDGGGFDDEGAWYEMYYRSHCHNTLDDVPIKPDPPEWFDSLQYMRTLKGTRRTWAR